MLPVRAAPEICLTEPMLWFYLRPETVYLSCLDNLQAAG